MTAIRVIFDGKSFIPQEPVSLPPQSQALVIVEQTDRAAEDEIDAAVRAYYEGGEDAEDEAWGKATSRQTHRRLVLTPLTSRDALCTSPTLVLTAGQQTIV